MDENEKRERKSSAITARLSDDDIIILNELSESTNKTVSDTILRAVKFLVNAVDISKIEEDESEQWGKVRKNNRVHLRLTDSDMELFDTYSSKYGKSIPKLIRIAIREYFRTLKGSF